MDFLSTKFQGTDSEQYSNLKIERRWKGMKEVYIKNRGENFQEQFNKYFKEQDDWKDFKLNLVLTTWFQNDGEARKFYSEFLKLDKDNIYYINWQIEGEYSDELAIVVGESLSQFINLYSLKIRIQEGGFGEKGMLSLSKCLKNLKNLHVLKLFIIDSFSGNQIEDSSKINLLNTIIEIKTLEILEQNIIQGWPTKDLLKLMSENQEEKSEQCLKQLSTLTYPTLISIQEEGDELTISQKGEYNSKIEEFCNHIKNNQNMITHLILERKYCHFYQNPVENLDFYKQQIAFCFQLPYLTEFENYIFYQTSADKINNGLVKYTKEKKILVLFILAFSIQIEKLLHYNPRSAILDFYFD